MAETLNYFVLAYNYPIKIYCVMCTQVRTRTKRVLTTRPSTHANELTHTRADWIDFFFTFSRAIFVGVTGQN